MVGKDPSSANAIAREKLFNLYARNWQLVTENPEIRVTPDLEDVFVCPLCFRMFQRESLSSDLLSLEHVPPRALGGKDKDCILTCTNCNNKTGSRLESPLATQLEAADVFAGIPGASIEIEYRPLPAGESMRLPATLKSVQGGYQIFGHPHRTDPELIEEVSTDEFMQSVTEFKLGLRNLDRACVAAALLKIAYLYVFRVFGYSVLIPESMQAVCRQITNPAERILPNSWLVNWPSLDERPGVSLVFWPDGLRAYLVVFALDTGRRRRMFGVVLPEPYDHGLAVHNRMLDGWAPRGVLVTFPKGVDLVGRPELCLYGLRMWAEFQEWATQSLEEANEL